MIKKDVVEHELVSKAERPVYVIVMYLYETWA